MGKSILTLFAVLLLRQSAYTQDRILDISGYIDAGAAWLGERTVSVGDTAFETRQSKFTYLTQRFNLLPSSEFGRVKIFANIEYNSGSGDEHKSGTFELFEAWSQYTFSDALKLRGGILTPPFGAFNATRDASPTFLGVLPPSVFDEGFEEIDFMPQFANVLIFGTTTVGSIDVEYALFTGNGIGTEGEMSIDGNNGKDYGARFAVTPSDDLTLGFSAWRSGVEDYESGISEVHTLFGTDVLFSSGDLEIRAEYIPGYDEINGVQFFKATGFVITSYTVEETVTPYVLFDYLRNDAHIKMSHIQNRISAGITYKPVWRTALKAQFIRDMYSRSGVDDISYFFVGVSILF
ncbi:MAG: hypothetical protein HYV29_00370 [Ignavibacteriales bacterium]|nr:hypothetical protein [Ignavibacteriales bacterium]